jgi:hypothetical protein
MGINQGVFDASYGHEFKFKCVTAEGQPDLLRPSCVNCPRAELPLEWCSVTSSKQVVVLVSKRAYKNYTATCVHQAGHLAGCQHAENGRKVLHR